MNDVCAREGYGRGRCVFLAVGCAGVGEHWCSGSSLGCGLMGRGEKICFFIIVREYIVWWVWSGAGSMVSFWGLQVHTTY